MKIRETAVPMMVRGDCTTKIRPTVNNDHLSDEVKLRVWQQAKTLKGVVIECVAG